MRNKEDKGKRIDAYLAEKTEFSRVHIQRIIEEEKITSKWKKNKRII